jgi:hypothetical protein
MSFDANAVLSRPIHLARGDAERAALRQLYRDITSGRQRRRGYRQDEAGDNLEARMEPAADTRTAQLAPTPFPQVGPMIRPGPMPMPGPMSPRPMPPGGLPRNPSPLPPTLGPEGYEEWPNRNPYQEPTPPERTGDPRQDRQRDHQHYHDVCDQRFADRRGGVGPEGRNVPGSWLKCEEALWDRNRAQRCLDLRQDSKERYGATPDSSQTDQREKDLARAKRRVEQDCRRPRREDNDFWNAQRLEAGLRGAREAIASAAR